MKGAMLLGTAMVLGGGSAAAQSMRTLTAARPLPVAAPATVARLDFGAGQVVLRAGDGNDLYRMVLRYDADRFQPVQRYDPETGALQLGVTSVGRGGLRVTSREQLAQVARFEFAPEVPLALHASLGSSEASIDLGGLTLTELSVRSGAVRGIIDFSRPTLGSCARATFSVGASELDVLRLANSGCAEVLVEGGVGRAVLDFSGEWRGDMEVEANLAMGQLVLRIPPDVGVQVVAERFLTAVSLEGLIKEGNSWSSPGFAEASRKVTVAVKTSLGSLEVVR
ncbi:MAG: hypothetical protein SFU57_02965 [Gemmatimonadales bacterium]|nr:hypothetical protein [Gemmatimonadales bacterium]